MSKYDDLIKRIDAALLERPYMRDTHTLNVEELLREARAALRDAEEA